MVTDAIELRLFYATKSRLFNAIELRLFYATESRLFNAIELRLFDARCAIVCAPWARGRKGEGSDDWLLMNDY